ncbi:GNAT family N-acetyltransferase [Actinophytocola glycyrrhizae]|uniref:GNAT family N-acetyltransferase n=1 Tax=Actinophytocola glycyrrhizae TaxID=2044873 RepID=A0ABV9RU71_9PSEU
MFDELMRAGWPATDEVAVDGWVARFAGGVTQRANSVLPFAAPADLGAALLRVERLYATRGLPTVFQLGPSAQPAGLDDVLAARGYEFGSPTSIQTAPVGDVRPDPSVRIAESPSDEWLDLWWRVDGRGDQSALDVAAEILCGGPALYATVRDTAGVAAVGRLALVGEWGGVYCMAVRPGVRRRGHGAAVLSGLLAAGRACGVTRAWLQVRAENTAAFSLYRKAGFTETSRYHYRSHRGQEPVQDVHPEP